MRFFCSNQSPNNFLNDSRQVPLKKKKKRIWNLFNAKHFEYNGGKIANAFVIVFPTGRSLLSNGTHQLPDVWMCAVDFRAYTFTTV
jgi:hypothetical protein